MRTPVQVAVVGDLLLDVRVAPATPRAGSDVPAAISLGPGGQGANLAVRLARRGLRVRLHCALASDATGSLLAAAMSDEGVDVDARAAVATGAVVILVDADGERTMLSQRVPLLPVDLQALEAEWLVVSGYALLEPDAALHLGALAVRPTRRALAGCAVEPADVERWLAAARALRPDLLVLNADEASVLAGGAGPAEAAGALAADLGAAVLAVTGTAEAVAALGDAVVRVESARNKALDTTGAGDAFTAALVAELREGAWPPDAAQLERAMAAGIEVGSAVAGVEGAQGRVPGERRQVPA